MIEIRAFIEGGFGPWVSKSPRTDFTGKSMSGQISDLTFLVNLVHLEYLLLGAWGALMDDGHHGREWTTWTLLQRLILGK